MLYTLVGNGNANHVEIVATLESLREAVAEPDEFWMMLRDPGAELSGTVKAIVEWLDTNVVYYEVVVWEGADLSPELKNADETHVARRTLDYLLKLTKHRIQPEEKAAILVLSDDLENDQEVLFAVERGGADGFSVYDLGGQMTQIIIDDGATIDDVLNEVEAKAPEVKAELANQPAPPVEGKLSNSELIHEQAVEETGLQHLLEAEKMRPKDAPLSYTRADLETLTRDELKALVKTKGVTPSDMRSKDSMRDALMAALEPLADTQMHEAAIEVTEPDIEGKDIDPSYTAEPVAVSDEFRDKVVNLNPPEEPAIPPAGFWYLIHIDQEGEFITVEIPPEKVAVIETVLSGE